LFKSKLSVTERFAEKTSNVEDIDKYEAVVFEENLKVLVPMCSVYITVFNTESYPESGQEWYNVAYKKREDCSRLENKIFSFENIPIFSRKNGILLGTNRLYGPYSNMLNISLQSTFTIFLACKHGDFLENNTDEIELLKLYANSDDNNGISLFVQSKSVKLVNNIQTGNLLFKFVDSTQPTQCLLNKSDNNIVFDKTNLSFYFIVKEIDKIRILYMAGNQPTIKEIAILNIKETSATFSNKELIINRFSNWKGSIYSMGIINKDIPDSDVTAIQSHIYSEYLKATSDDYIELSNTYNEVIDYLKKFTKCPYDQTVCDACKTVTKWNDINQLLTSPPECRDAINQFCKSNSKHALCKCWDSSYFAYNSDTCKMYRKMFDTKKNHWDDLSQDDLNYVREKYKLIYESDCPKPVISNLNCVKDELTKNVYGEYDYQKMKVNPKNLDGLKSINYKVDSPYASEPIDESDKKSVTNYYGKRSDYDPHKTKNTVSDLAIDNPYYKDAQQNSDKDTSKGNAPSDSKEKQNKEKDENLKKAVVNQESSDSKTMFGNETNPFSISGGNKDGRTIVNLYQNDPNSNFDQSKNVAFKEYDKSNDLQEKNEKTPVVKSLFSWLLPSQ
jgi:hypothetical protein